MYEFYKKLLDVAAGIGTIRECKFKKNPEHWQDAIGITCISGGNVVEISVSVKRAEEEPGDDS